MRGALLALVTLIGCSSPPSLVGEIPEDPCEYQGSVHRAKRGEIDQDLTNDLIDRVEWLCQARALERMDTSLAFACNAGEPTAPLFAVLEDEFAECFQHRIRERNAEEG